jgi:uncharacterized protein
MDVITNFRFETKEIENEWITLADGSKLASRIWMPKAADQQAFPVILEYLPYRKRDGTHVRDALTHPYFAGNGYVCVRVDMRGNGDSDGLMFDEYLKQEQDDALEVIKWLVEQDWCDGNVGMMGISWGGFNALQVAARQPEALKAIITLCSTVDRFNDDIHYKGGCLLNENLGWSSTMLAYSSRPPDPDIVGENWRDMWLHRMENQPHLAETWLGHQHKDDYWKHGSVGEDFSKIKAAVFTLGGWNDAYMNAPPALMKNLNAPNIGIIGPWLHKYPHFAIPDPAIGFLQEALRWWDHWLKGIDTGVMEEPQFRTFMLDSEPASASATVKQGRWVAEDKWPSSDIYKKQLFLSDGSLQDTVDSEKVESDCSPQDLGVASGEYCQIWLGPEAPGEQRVDNGGALVCQTAPLIDPIEILGAPRLRIKLASDQSTGKIVVRLNSVHPSGSTTRVSYAVLNLCHRYSNEAPQFLEPGKFEMIDVVLDNVGKTFAVGDCIQVAISTTYWPLTWPSPEVTTLSVHEGAETFLELPVRPIRDEEEVKMPPPESSKPAEHKLVREPEKQRFSTRDMKTGLSHFHILDDDGVSEDLNTGLLLESIAREHYQISPDDPTSAFVETHWTKSRARGGWEIRTETKASLSSDKDNFYVKAKLEAFEGDELVFEKDWDKTIKRNMV